MKKWIQVQWTCDQVDLARRVLTRLLEEKVILSADIFPEVESIALEEERLGINKGVKIFMKTKRRFLSKMEKIIEEMCGYELSEILVFSAEERGSC